MRLLEEYPDPHSGLSRTQPQILALVRQGIAKPGQLFAKYMDTEQYRFVGGSVFWSYLQQMLDNVSPLLHLPNYTCPRDSDLAYPLQRSSFRHLLITAKPDWQGKSRSKPTGTENP